VDVTKLSNEEKYQFKKKNKLVRSISVMITVVITIILLVIIVAMLFPELIKSISGLVEDFPTYIRNLYSQTIQWIDNNPSVNTLFGEQLEEKISNIQKQLLQLFSEFKPNFDKVMDAVGKGISGVVGGVKNFAIGFILSVYLLFSKEDFIAQIRKGMFAIFPTDFTKKLLSIGSKTNSIFSDFLVGKAVDSLIIGVICFIGLTIMQMPYTVLISILVGITNMIPFFGPFIGAVPSAILVLLTEPKRTIAFIIFIVVLQQIDGNIIGPKILGNKMGLSTFWIVFAILVFGGLFNVVGMFIGVPVFTIIYISVNSFVEDRLKAKNMPMDKRYYKNMTITEKECDFPEKQDFSDEDIDEDSLPPKKDYLLIVKDKAILLFNKVKSMVKKK
jgi:predicted PurR-regulated permease PerM